MDLHFLTNKKTTPNSAPRGFVLHNAQGVSSLRPTWVLPDAIRTDVPYCFSPHGLFPPFHIPPPLQTQRAAPPAQLPKLLQKPQPLFKDLNKEHCPVLLTLLSPAMLLQIRMSKGHKISPSKEKPTTKKAYRDGDCPTNSTPLSASQHPCSRGHPCINALRDALP